MTRRPRRMHPARAVFFGAISVAGFLAFVYIVLFVVALVTMDWNF